MVEVIDPDLIILRSDERQIGRAARLVYRHDGQLRISPDQLGGFQVAGDRDLGPPAEDLLKIACRGFDRINFGHVIQGFEEGVVGMKVGESKVVEIPVAKAYGERNDEMVIQAPIEQVPPDLKPELGMRLEMGGANGEVLRVVVVEIADTHITLDANPPLAGEDLIFEIELVECAAP